VQLPEQNLAPNPATPKSAQDGEEFECVEFVRRFYRIAKSIATAAWYGDAKDIYPNGPQFGLVQFMNGGSTPPQPDDIVGFDITATNPNGHVAIIKSIDLSGCVAGTTQAQFTAELIEQNTNTKNSVTGNRHELQGQCQQQLGASSTFVLNPRCPSCSQIQGWLRLPSASQGGTAASYLIADSTSPGCLATTGRLVKLATDGGSATTLASVSPPPNGVALDGAGNAFVTQPCGNSISKVTPTGAVSVVFAGSPLQHPVAIALDALGNILVGDNETDSLFRITPSGNSIVEVAKLPVPSPGVAQDMAIVVDWAGNYIVGNDEVGGVAGTSEILRISPAGSVTTIYDGNTIQSISGITIDSERNYVVSDFRQSEILRVTPGGAVSQITSGTSLCCNLVGLARDPFSGNFLSTLNSGDKVLTITPGGAVTTLFSGGPLQYPAGVAVLP
jgi:streptogramin lyase